MRLTFERKTNKRGRSTLIYIKTNLMYRIRKDLSIYDKGKKILTSEIISIESRTYCFLAVIGLLRVSENLTAYLASVCQGVQNDKKKSFIIEDFNLNCLNYNEGSNIRRFHHKVFELRLFFLLATIHRFIKAARQ